VICEPAVMPRDHKCQRECRALERQRGTGPGVFRLFAAAVKSTLKLSAVLSEVVPKSREVPPVAGVEHAGKLSCQRCNVLQVGFERFPRNSRLAG